MAVAPSPHAYGGQGPVMMGITWTFALVATIVLILRTYVGLRITRRLRWDLFWVISAWFIAIVAQALLSVAASYGAGQHKQKLVATDMPMVVKFQWIGTWLCLLSGGVGKIAVVALILQIQGATVTRPKRYFLHFIWASAMLIDVMQVIMLINQCSPPWKLWYTKTPGTCNLVKTASNTGEFTGAWSAVCDISLAVYPATMFWDLSLSTRKKICLSLLMGCGVIAGATAAVKTGFVKLSTSTTDPTYISTPLKILLYVETWLIIILGSIPTLKPLFDRSARATSSLRSDSSRSSTSGGIAINEKGHVRIASRELVSPRHDSFSNQPSRTGFFASTRTKSQEPLRTSDTELGGIYVTTDFGLESQQVQSSHSSRSPLPPPPPPCPFERQMLPRSCF